MRVKSFALLAFTLLSPLCVAFGASFSELVVFGDSLSDNGNAYLFTSGIAPGDNYGTYTLPGTSRIIKYFSDGPNTTPVGAGPQGVWIDQLAAKLGVSDPLPVLLAGSNYASGGAKTGAGDQNVGTQVAAFTATHLTGASSTALYTFWAGADDVFSGGDTPTKAADNIAGYIAGLSDEGAKNFIWLNLPLLGDTPFGQTAGKSALNAASVAFNTEWSHDLTALHAMGISVIGVDIERLFSNIVANPAAYNLTNVTDSAQGLNIPSDAGYLFWDDVHPTTAGHALVADTAFNSLNAVPEPGSVSLALAGAFLLAGLAAARKRRLQ